MVNEAIIFAGFGGQGILLSGRLICIAAMREGKFVSHIPSYGAEMRGGTANCGVVVSTGEIASPVVRHPSICVLMNKPSLSKFESRVQAGGLLIYNSSLIDIAPARSDIEIVPVAANDLAQEEGDARAANMITLGLLIKKRPQLAGVDALIAALEEAVSLRNQALNQINTRCLRRGFTLNIQ